MLNSVRFRTNSECTKKNPPHFHLFYIDESFKVLKSVKTKYFPKSMHCATFRTVHLSYISIYRYATSLHVFVKNLSMWDEKCFLDLKSKALWDESP